VHILQHPRGTRGRVGRSPSQRLTQNGTSAQQLKTIPQVKIQPNPASGHVLITSTEYVDGTVSIVDIVGKNVINQKFSGTMVELNVSLLNQGFYHYIIRNYAGNIIYIGNLAVIR
jgi:hypothetical protein